MRVFLRIMILSHLDLLTVTNEVEENELRGGGTVVHHTSGNRNLFARLLTVRHGVVLGTVLRNAHVGRELVRVWVDALCLERLECGVTVLSVLGWVNFLLDDRFLRLGWRSSSGLGSLGSVLI